MEFLTVLWLPVLLSAVFVFVVSSIIHMALPAWHKGEYKKLDGEDELLDQMRKHGAHPGEYMFPCVDSMKEMSTPEMIKKYEKGPVGFMTVVASGQPVMGKNLAQWFLYSVLVGFLVAYVAMHSLARGSEYLAVFRVTGTVATIGYAVTHIPDSIWKGRPWGSTFKHVVDGVLYGLVTAGTFGWLWPGA